jgi:hypothetical protein
VLRQPGLERRRRLAGGVFSPRPVQIHSVPAKRNKPKKFKNLIRVKYNPLKKLKKRKSSV